MNPKAVGTNVEGANDVQLKGSYRRPELMVFGAISEFTATGSGTMTENPADPALPTKKP